MPNPPCVDAFFQHNVIIGKSGLWHTKYFPGQALWLTPGMVLGVPWLMMPLGWAITIFFFGKLVRRFYPPIESLISLTLMTLSPLGCLVAASFMSHTTFLMFLLAGLYLTARGYDAAKRWHGSLFYAGGGLMTGLAAITRPQDIAPYLAGGFVLILLLSTGQRRQLARGIPALFLGGLIPVMGLLYWNNALYGSWFSSGYHFGTSPSLTPIIHDALGFSGAHSPARALRFAALTLYRFDSALTGWPGVLALMIIPLLRYPQTARDVVAAAVFSSTVLLYLLFHYLGFELEARYYTPAIPAGLVLAAGGFVSLCRLLTRNDQHAARALMLALLIGGGVYSFGYYWPRYLWPKYADTYEQVSSAMHDHVEAWRVRHPESPKVLALIESSDAHDFNFSAGFVFNKPDLSGPVVFARYLNAELPCLREAFPDRTLVHLSPDGLVLTPLDHVQVR